MILSKYMKTYITLIKLNLIILCATCMSGCGIYSFTGASIPPETKTFSVINFVNMSQEATPPGITNTLTEELKDIFLKQTRLSLVQTDGDFAFEGEIRSYIHGPVAITSNDVAAKERLTISVKVVFKNRYDETTSFDKTFSQYAEYETTTSFASAENGLVEEIVEKLVEDIFNAAAANW